VQVEDEQLLVGGEVAALHVRAEVVQPTKTAALPSAIQACHKHPAALQMIISLLAGLSIYPSIGGGVSRRQPTGDR
jgi:hypothetical protein